MKDNKQYLHSLFIHEKDLLYIYIFSRGCFPPGVVHFHSFKYFARTDPFSSIGVKVKAEQKKTQTALTILSAVFPNKPKRKMRNAHSRSFYTSCATFRGFI